MEGQKYNSEAVETGDACRSCGGRMQGRGLGVKRCCGCCHGTCESCLSAETRQCTECGMSFKVTDSEKAFFASKQISTPRRCKPCLRAKRERILQEGRGN